MGHLKPDSTNDKKAGKEVVGVRTFNDILNLAYFEFLAESVLQMAKYDEKKGILGELSIPTTPRHQIDDEFAPSKALKCRYSNTCGDEEDVIKLKRFDEMLDTQLANVVGRLASHSKKWERLRSLCKFHLKWYYQALQLHCEPV